MKIPKKIKIGGHAIKITFSSDIELAGAMGGYKYASQSICISKEISKSQQEETLIHEIVEAINGIYEFNLTHDKIQILGAVLHQIIKDNPGMFENERKNAKHKR
ncbi:MAG: hypothetical protein KAZ87_15000 [Spirochaetes bacterium]|nr:hypothetical protein [Spirochaetota bacterium]